jgi:hypothetical protein
MFPICAVAPMMYRKVPCPYSPISDLNDLRVFNEKAAAGDQDSKALPSMIEVGRGRWCQPLAGSGAT